MCITFMIRTKEQLSNSENLYRTMHNASPAYREINHGIMRLQHWVHLLRPFTSILEVGCGNGHLCKVLTRMELDVTGLDITEGPYERKGYDFVKHDITQGLPFKDNEFDYCLSFDVLEHLRPERVEDTIREMFRVGRCVVFSISCAARGILHPTVRPPEWWLEILNRLYPGREDMTFKIFTRHGTTEQTVLFYVSQNKQ